MDKKVWKRPVTGWSPIKRRNYKLQALHKHLFFFWARHVTSILKREKLRLSSIIDELESLAEVRLVYTHEIELKSQSNAQIVDLLGERELKWYQ
jgi:hypothetical protein